MFVDHVPERSAEAVLRCEAAGFAVHSKTNLHELAYGTTSQNPWFGTVPNPRAPGRIAGGSSGGAAAPPAPRPPEHAPGPDSRGPVQDPPAGCGGTWLQPTPRPRPVDRGFPPPPPL